MPSIHLVITGEKRLNLLTLSHPHTRMQGGGNSPGLSDLSRGTHRVMNPSRPQFFVLQATKAGHGGLGMRLTQYPLHL